MYAVRLSEMSADFVGLLGVVFHKIRLFEYLLLLLRITPRP
jgi:hypothetical protein